MPIASLRPGDLVLIRPGERVPGDGIVTEGQSWLDQSMFTGEPIPVARQPGDPLLAGSVNQGGALTMRIEKRADDTLLSGIIRMVEDAQEARLPIQALVDRVTHWFVPAVLVIAAITFAAWLPSGLAPALTHAVAVLIIACPCAMGLAMPVAIMVGTGRAAREGILFRQG